MLERNMLMVMICIKVYIVNSESFPKESTIMHLQSSHRCPYNATWYNINMYVIKNVHITYVMDYQLELAWLGLASVVSIAPTIQRFKCQDILFHNQPTSRRRGLKMQN
jgi:hypothetical protein